MTFLKKTMLILTVCVFSACSNETQTVPPSDAKGNPAATGATPSVPESTEKPITMFTREQIAELAAYFGISLTGIASAEYTKLVPGTEKDRISVTAATVLSYIDTKKTERAGSVTAQISGTYGGRPFTDIRITFTGFTDPYGSAVQSAGTLVLDFDKAIETAQHIDEYIAAANEQPRSYIKAFSFGLENGTRIDALNTKNRNYSVENIQLAKAADTEPYIKATAQYKVHYFSRESGKNEEKETVDYQWRYKLEVKTPFYIKTDVFNRILEDPQLFLQNSAAYSGYASKIYAQHRFEKRPVWNQLFNSETFERYNRIYPAYAPILVSIDQLNANDYTGELHVTYRIASVEDIEQGLHTASRYETRTFGGFKKIDAEELKKMIEPFIMLTDTTARHTLFDKYDRKFKAGLADNTYTIADTTSVLPLETAGFTYNKAASIVRETNDGILVGDGNYQTENPKDGFSNGKMKIMFGPHQKTAHDIFSVQPPYLADEQLFISHVAVHPVSVTVNPTHMRGENYIYSYNYEVSFTIQASKTSGSDETESLAVSAPMLIWKTANIQP